MPSATEVLRCGQGMSV